ncbi:16S rRNA (cytosine(967)-C(5))-methyltransferase RsmB [Bacillus sp. Marseille-P3661]|uniref:16S rRNA (cytosine(967)-C(5))-methyltransferase RsmB n=1 Tax=Bacillus sp. Marseille-P3661 TaxID=1936234 RepID=UPI000C85693F|nr:16S rRNA (cytosine(967)-C(5))-methyltransferase RsmB [Bacillus sp. Marseille-P3661]
MKNKAVRDVALDILLQIEKNQAYSNLLLNQMIHKNNLNQKDIGLLTEIVYGTIQRQFTLDYYLESFIVNKKKVEPWVIILLRLSIYQMVYLDRIPAHAVINEAVEIAKKRGHRGISGMVNGVLRSVQRKGLPNTIDIDDPIERLSIQVSYPKWLIEKWVQQFGLDETRKMCENSLIPPSVTARVNSTRTTIEEIISLLQKETITAEQGDLSVDAIKIVKGNLTKSTPFNEGLVTIQDESSMLVARALDVLPNQMILDSCAAPGGKTTHIAELLNGSGKVVAVDLHPHKVKLIEEQLNRLRLSNVETRVSDSRKLRELFEPETFDRILVDAPCSGFGVIRRKPDIKYSKTANDVKGLASIQLSILDSIAPLLKKGGKLVYSTCTIDPEENDGVVEQFLHSHPEYTYDESLIDRMPQHVRPLTKEGRLQILPHYFGSDGFFIASFRKQV